MKEVGIFISEDYAYQIVLVFSFLFVLYTMNAVAVSVRFSVKISKRKAGYRERKNM